MIYHYGNAPVPWTVMWSEEDADYYVAECAWFRVPAICHKLAQGKGVPRFGSSHAMRHRQVLHEDLCDLCAKPLRNRTKVSMGMVFSLPFIEFPVQAEPLLHRECALISYQHCPSLQRQAANDQLNIRQVFQYRIKLTPAGPKERARVPDCKLPLFGGLAVVEIIRQIERDLRWLKGS